MIHDSDGAPVTIDDEHAATELAPAVVTGVDVQAISRFEAEELLDGVLQRAFTPAERAYCERTGHPAQHFAARWAAKEAFRKLLDDVAGLQLASVAVQRRSDGPHLSLEPSARRALTESLGTTPWETAVSLSHDRDADVAAAQVVAVGGAQP